MPSYARPVQPKPPAAVMVSKRPVPVFPYDRLMVSPKEKYKRQVKAYDFLHDITLYFI